MVKKIMETRRLLFGSLSLQLVLLGGGCTPTTSNQQMSPTSAALLAQLQEDHNEIIRLKGELRELRTKAAAAPGGNLPAPPPLPTSDSKLINDIACRKKLVFTDNNGDNLPAPGTKPGSNRTPAGTKIGDTWVGCEELNPVTRLVLENAVAGASDTYTNQAGYLGSPSPIVHQTQNVYQFGIGYSQKPILKQFRRLLDINDYEDVPDPSIGNQGSWAEDFIFNAVLLNAGVAYGQSLVIKNGTATTTSYSRPSYSVGVTYALDLERAYVDLLYGSTGDSRLADPGYIFTPQPPPYSPGSPKFWQGYRWW